MISSYEVNNIVAQQQQMMMASQQYGQQMGAPAYGYSPHMLASGISVGQSFSYKNSELNYGLGNQAGMGAVGGAGMAFKAASMGVTAAGAYAGFKMTGSAMGAIRGGMAAGGPLFAAGAMAGGHVFGNMMEGAEENQQVYKTLGNNFNFPSSSARTGRGFGRQESRAIAEFTRELQSLPELMTSMGELTNIMNKVSQTGVMSGVRNAQEFNRRFKETIGTLKEVAKTMQTSMDEAVKFFEESKRSGFYSPGSIKANASQRQFVGGLTGMNQNQVGQLQLMGSQNAASYGGSRGMGAMNALRTAGQIGVANELGIISNERIQELTGMAGSEGIQALAGTMTGAAQIMSQGSVGSAMAMALGQVDKNGRFTGAMDSDIADKIRNNGITKSQLLALAHKKTSSRVGKMSFASQRSKLTANMASTVGVEGIGMELQEILGEAGFNNPDATNLVMQKYGVDEGNARAIQEVIQGMPQIQREMGSKAQLEGRRQAEQGYMRENFSTDAIKKKISTRISNALSEPFKKLGAKISDTVADSVDNFMDGMIGRHSTQITKATSSAAATALSGGDTSEMKGLLSAITGSDVRTGGVTLGAGERLIGSLTGTNTPELNKYNALKELVGSGMASYGKGDSITQSPKQMEDMRRHFGDLQNGNLGDKLANLKTGATKPGNEYMLKQVKEGIAEITNEHASELKNMSQAERISFIKEKLTSGIFSKTKNASNTLAMGGLTIEEQIAYSQSKSGTSDNLGAVNFNKLGNELVGGGDFEAAPELSKRLREVTGDFAKQFGNQEDAAKAMLGNDSKSRDLLLKATSGDEDAKKLLTKDLPVQERDRLMRKFGIKESELEGVMDVYGGAKGKNLQDLSKTFSAASARGSVAGLATQLRRAGGDMESRLSTSGLSSDVGYSIMRLSGQLTGLTSADKLNEFFNGGGYQSIDKVLDKVSGLKGDEKSKALSVLGEGAKSAIDLGEKITRGAMKKGGLDNAGLSEDLQSFVNERKGKDGTLSKKDAEELGKKARDRAFASGLTREGTAQSRELAAQKDYLENLNKFAQTTSQFATLVIQATPQLNERVQKAGRDIPVNIARPEGE
jgi:hypothetical protein